MITVNWDQQVDSLLKPDGTPTQVTAFFPPMKKAKNSSGQPTVIDPTSSARLWSAGKDIEGGGFTPPGSPPGLPNWVRLSPFNQKWLTGEASRPRSQMNLGHPPKIQIDGVMHEQQGEFGEKRAVFGYFCIAPGYAMVPGNPDSDKDICNMLQFHGEGSAPSRIGRATSTLLMQYDVPGIVTNPHTGPFKLAFRVTGGRHTAKVPGKAAPDHPWDDYIPLPAEQAGTDNGGATLSWMEIQRSFDLIPGGYVIPGKPYSFCIEHDYDYRVGQGTLNVWLEGNHMVGPGAPNVLLDGPRSRPSSEGGYWPLDQTGLPSNYYDMDMAAGRVTYYDPVKKRNWTQAELEAAFCPQHPIFMVNNYRPLQSWTDAKSYKNNGVAASWYDEALWDRYVYTVNNAVWYTGVQIATDKAEFPYDQPAEIVESGIYEAFPVFGPRVATDLDLGASYEEGFLAESFQVLDLGVRKYPRFVERRDGEVRTQRRQYTGT